LRECINAYDRSIDQVGEIEHYPAALSVSS
jgi:hypothetical protein